SLDLSSLQAVGGVTTDSGYTNLVLDGSTATVGPLQSANRLGVTLTNGAAMTIGGFAGDAALTNSGFVVSGGSKLDASRLVGSLNESGLNASTFLNASGAGSLINLSGLRTLDVGSNGPNGNAIQASSGAKIDLSGVTSLQPPVNSAAISINASGGSIDLSSLQTINGIPVGQSVRGSAGAGNALLTGGPGQVAFNVSGAGSLLLHGMAVGSGVHFNLTDTGSTLTLNGGLTLLAGSTLSAGSGTQVDVDGSYSFQQTVESQVATDLATLAMTNAGGHVVEVGGKDNGRPTGTGTVTSNFAWGQLDVGQAGTANTVELADLVDNGNRTSTSAEALYLNGGSGVSGLHILGGSTLVLDRVDLYSMENGQWTYINGLFGAGVTRIAYDQGYIALVPEPGSLALLLSGLGLVGIRLRRAKVRE
ncbi:MAG: PEP-CTERM sorting domain-containing protein, partial [Proteobacteria bacterium]|nr:PEP-CTERM sorting domain-containing protein [Pseudomonadota bacterium]